MTSFDTEIKKYTEKIHLKASERRDLRERVFAYMEYHPLPKSSLDTSSFKGEYIISSPFTTFHFNLIYKRVVSGVVVLLLVLAPFVAEKSVPGDVLYIVKTGLNEQIQSQLATTPYEKIEFETKLMERRIGEARVLATEGKLTEEVKTQIAETVKGHTEAVKHEIAGLREDDADGASIASIEFNASLEVQSAMIEATTMSATNTTQMDTILTIVNDAHSEGVSTQGEQTLSYESLIAQVEQETTRAYELFTSKKMVATGEEIVDIDRRLSDINRITTEAKERVTQDGEKASEDLAKTLGLIQKLITFMTDIEVQEIVALENLVPVVLSDEERIAIVEAEIDTLGTTLKEEITARLVLISDAGVVEKATLGLVTVDELILKATVALEAGDVSTAEDASREARAFMTDIDAMTQTVRGEDGVPVTGAEEGEVVSEEGGVEETDGEEVLPNTETGDVEGSQGTTTPETVSQGEFDGSVEG